VRRDVLVEPAERAAGRVRAGGVRAGAEEKLVFDVALVLDRDLPPVVSERVTRVPRLPLRRRGEAVGVADDLHIVQVAGLLRDDRRRQRPTLLVRAGEDDDPALAGAGGGGCCGDGTDRADDRPRRGGDGGDPERLARLDELPGVADLGVGALVRGDREVRVTRGGGGGERRVAGEEHVLLPLLLEALRRLD